MRRSALLACVLAVLMVQGLCARPHKEQQQVLEQQAQPTAALPIDLVSGNFSAAFKKLPDDAPVVMEFYAS